VESIPDLDLADLVYYKQIEWEQQYGKIISNMKNYGKVVENLDFTTRKTY
jgi:hypothetical protein